MLYTDTESFFLHFFVEDLAKELNAGPHLRDAFDFSEISNGHLSNIKRGNADLHAKEVAYFKDESKSNSIVEIVGLRPKMYSFTLCDASKPIPWVSCAAQSGGKKCGALPNQALQARGLRAHVNLLSPDQYGQLPYRLQTPPGAPD